MNSPGFNFIITWGLWILGIGIILVVGLLWCIDVNKKLQYILARLEEAGLGNYSDLLASGKKMDQSTVPGKPVPTIVVVFIIGVAIILLFIIPVWLINK